MTPLVVCITVATLGAAPGPGRPLPPAGAGAILLDARGDQALFGLPDPEPPRSDDVPRMVLERWEGDAQGPAPLGDERVSHARFLDDARLVVTTPVGELVVVDVRGAGRVTLDVDVRGAAGSTADGRVLVYARGEAPWLEIWRLDEGGGPRPVTTTMGPAWSPAISPDGRTVVFASARSGVPALWRTVDDGAPVQISSLGVTSRPDEVPRVDPFPASLGAPIVAADRVVFEGRRGVHVVDLTGRVLATLPRAHAPHWGLGEGIGVVLDGRLRVLDAVSPVDGGGR